MLYKPAYAVVLDRDRARSLSLRHMFMVICGLSCEVYPDPESFLEEQTGDHPPKVIILGDVDDRPRALRAVASQHQSFVLVIERPGDALTVENAFLAGADDVLRTPFTLRELALRLRARIGMLESSDSEDLFLEASNWGEEAYIAERAGLTESEAQILHVLISNSGKIVSRDALSLAIDGRAWDYGDRKFDVHVAKIRKKLTSTFGDHISVQTVRSAGYILSIDEVGHADLMNAIG
ncbi:winged helix-turn-helix domain-containing protein [Cognatishimia sp.]|uniref:winged helix-turn-helix domain-containing protein n=1 Tax=Cognatishimia sp. TaxID=2211648 RepID=UPI003511772F